MKFLPLFFPLLFALLCTSMAHAEKADRNKPINIETEHSDLDEKNGVRTLTGKVKLVQGSMVIEADKMVVQENSTGDMKADLFSTLGKKVRFRQKHYAGENQWMDGEADQIIYDQKSGLLTFIKNASVRRLDGTELMSRTEAEFMQYNMKTEQVVATNSNTGKRIEDGGKVQITIVPKPDGAVK